MSQKEDDMNDLSSELDSLVQKAKPSEAQKSFNALSMEAKFERLNQLVQQSQIYSQIILENMMEKALNKKLTQEIPELKEPTKKENSEEGIQPEIDRHDEDHDLEDIPVRHSSRLAKKSLSEKSSIQTKRRTKPKRSVRAKSTKSISTSEVSKKTIETKKAIEAAQTNHKQKQPAIVSGCVMKDYQLDGLEWLVSLYENGLNGILADEMGLGKTLQCISLYGYLMEHGVKGPFLVVAPLSTVSNWCNEFKKFAPQISVLQYVGSKEKRSGMSLQSKNFANVTVTSYEIMIRDHSKFAKVDWEYLTVDEGHRLKNFQSILIQYLKKLRVGNRLLLTGTPLQNNLKELWSLLNFILPEIFQDLELFESWFDFDDLTSLEVSGIEEKERTFVKEKMQSEFVKHLQSILRPFLLRRLKEIVIKDLPPKKEYIIFADLTPIQRVLYQGAVDGILYNTVVQLYLKEYLLQNYPDIINDEDDLDYVDNILRKKYSSEMGKKRKRETYYSDEQLLLFQDGPDREKSSKKDQREHLRKRPFLSPAQINHSEEYEIAKVHVSDSASDSMKIPRKSRNAKKTKESEDENFRNLEDVDAKHFVSDKVMNACENVLPPQESREEIVTRVLRTIESHAKNLSLQNGIMQLRKICATHYTFYEPFPFEPADETKFDKRLADLLVKNSGKIQILEQLTKRLLEDKHKVLIFSQFTRVLDLIALHYKQRGIKCSRLDGRMNQEIRTEEIDLFSSQGKSSTKIFLLSTRAGGLGLNLVHADTVILFDNDWNPQMDLQAIDRVHRIGQKNPVKIFRFVVRDTVEELLIMKSFNKRALERMVIESGQFQLGRMAKQLAAENIDISTIDSFNSVLELGKRLHLHEPGASSMLYKTNPVLMGQIEKSSGKLTSEEMDELMDRSLQCYQRGPRNFANITAFETTNNMDK
ncbi:hypothetical protein JCM33374_g167 [Metschnikowia sp. JCM 33374]|nr:hypothetical protein JCM33374_g167 [Metschnikowia sp. JCM 33374]